MVNSAPPTATSPLQLGCAATFNVRATACEGLGFGQPYRMPCNVALQLFKSMMAPPYRRPTDFTVSGLYLQDVSGRSEAYPATTQHTPSEAATKVGDFINRPLYPQSNRPPRECNVIGYGG